MPLIRYHDDDYENDWIPLTVDEENPDGDWDHWDKEEPNTIRIVTPTKHSRLVTSPICSIWKSNSVRAKTWFKNLESSRKSFNQFHQLSIITI